MENELMTISYVALLWTAVMWIVWLSWAYTRGYEVRDDDSES